MQIEKMREGFELLIREDCEAAGIEPPDLRISPCVLDDGAPIYVNDMTQGCWWAYRKGWNASRESLVIELPDHRCYDLPGEAYPAIQDCREAIEAAGVKVKP